MDEALDLVHVGLRRRGVERDRVPVVVRHGDRRRGGRERAPARWGGSEALVAGKRAERSRGRAAGFGELGKVRGFAGSCLTALPAGRD